MGLGGISVLIPLVGLLLVSSLPLGSLAMSIAGEKLVGPIKLGLPLHPSEQSIFATINRDASVFAEDLSQLCAHPGVKCEADGEYQRVSELDLSAQIKTTQALCSLFQLPHLQRLAVRDSALSGALHCAAPVSSRLVALDLSNNRLQHSIPHWILSRQWASLSLANNDFDCPTEQQLATLSASSGQMHVARPLSPDASDRLLPPPSHLFGLHDCTPLASYPKVQVLPTRRAFKPTGMPDFTFDANSLLVEVYGSVFAFFRLGPDGTPFRDEFTSMDIQGILKGTKTPTGAVTVDEEVPIAHFTHSSVLELVDYTVELKTTLSNGAKYAIWFTFPSSADQGGVKFSYRLESYPNNKETSYFSFPMQWTVHSPASETGQGLVQTLDAFSGQLSLISPITTAAIETIIDGASGEQQLAISSASERFESQIQFPTFYSVDNARSARQMSTEVLLSTFTVAPKDVMPASPYTTVLRVLPLRDQCLTVLASLVFNEGFDKALEYDPDIQLGLIFAVPLTPPTSPDEPPALSSEQRLGIIIGCVIAGTALVIILALSLYVFRRKIFPNQFRDPRKLEITKAAIEEDTNPEKATELQAPKAAWKNPDRPEVTNT